MTATTAAIVATVAVVTAVAASTATTPTSIVACPTLGLLPGMRGRGRGGQVLLLLLLGLVGLLGLRLLSRCLPLPLPFRLQAFTQDSDRRVGFPIPELLQGTGTPLRPAMIAAATQQASPFFQPHDELLHRGSLDRHGLVRRGVFELLAPRFSLVGESFGTVLLGPLPGFGKGPGGLGLSLCRLTRLLVGGLL